MDQKDRFDGYLKLAEFSSKNFHGRQVFEYQVTMAYWALLTAAIAIVGHAPADIPKNVPRWIVIASVAGYTCFLVRGTWVANENDQLSARHFRDAAEKIIHDPEYMPTPRPKKIATHEFRWWFGFLSSWSRLFQLLTSAALAVVLFLAMPSTN